MAEVDWAAWEVVADAVVVEVGVALAELTALEVVVAEVDVIVAVEVAVLVVVIVGVVVVVVVAGVTMSVSMADSLYPPPLPVTTTV
ncbi:MAG: hypothetical protein JRN59_08225 [Nitrososphaerota archaeon]|nr:hypothetical protein [Nitrososphaerota archaeon]MDG6921501.1 hypothetical protein [Nitrososphaerota archaeon]